MHAAAMYNLCRPALPACRPARGDPPPTASAPSVALPRLPMLLPLHASSDSRAGSWLSRQRRHAQLIACRASDAEPTLPLPLMLSSDEEPVPLPETSSTAAQPPADDGCSQPCGAASSEGSDEDDGAVRIDLQLPRRSLLVQFTCNGCGGRSERLVNPVAWERGLVIAQCQHCQAWHKLADAAGLVEEIRFTDE